MVPYLETEGDMFGRILKKEIRGRRNGFTKIFTILRFVEGPTDVEDCTLVPKFRVLVSYGSIIIVP